MKQAKTLTAAELRRVTDSIATRAHAARNRAMFALSYFCGLRAKEIASLTVGDVLKADGSIKDVSYLRAAQTKGEKGREFYINKHAKSHVAAYLKECWKAAPDHPLITVMGKRKAFSANGIAIAMRNIYMAAGFTGCSSHTGRRSAISQLANKGVGIRIIQKFSGHRQLQSVQHYLDANEEMVKNAVELLV